MQEKTLTKIALVTVLVGLVGLYVLSSLSPPPVVSVEELDLYNEKTVKVKGVVTQARDTENVAFLTVSQERMDSVSVVLFKDHEVDVAEGSYIEVEGVVEEYRGSKEIIANKVEIR